MIRSTAPSGSQPPSMPGLGNLMPRGHRRAEVRRLLGRRRRRHQARRPADRRRPSKAGHDVVVVVSAMGDTTDELLDLAEQVSPLPPARELDMLLTAGERISMALLAMAIADARLRGAVVHRLAGRRHHRRRPRQGPDHRRHARAASRRRSTGHDRRSSPASRASARTPRRSPRSAAAAPTPPRWRSPRPSRPTLRDLHR